MNVSVGPLRELHELHQRVSRLRTQLERGPRQVEAKRNLLNQRAELLDKTKAELKSIKVKSHERETERKAFEGRISQLQMQINTAKSNKEYTTLVSEKETAVKARTAVEDQVLELLLQEEEKAKEMKLLESEVSRLQQELTELTASTARQEQELAAKLAETESRLKSSEAALPSEMRDVYRRLVDRRGDDALAQASNGTCTGCYTGITPQMQNQLLINELVLCKSCGRILYQSDSPLPASSEVD